MYLYTLAAIVALFIYGAILGVGVYLVYLVIRALRKYIGSQEVRKEAAAVRKSLSEILRENRIHCKMTQEFVAETLGVSRQAVSKWENGTADPSTSNVIALAKLYGISAEEILHSAANPKNYQDQEDQ